MSKVIGRVLPFTVVVLASMFLVLANTNYCGVKFTLYYDETLLNILIIGTLLLMREHRPNSLFSKNGLCRTIRIGSRKRCLFKEIKMLVREVLIFVLLHSSLLIVFSTIFCKEFQVNSIFIYCLLNAVGVMTLASFQLLIQVKNKKGLGLYISLSLYVFGLLLGQALYELSTMLTNVTILKIIRVIQLIDLVNYMSLTRINLLNMSFVNAMLIEVFVLTVVVITIIKMVKKVDIIDED